MTEVTRILCQRLKRPRLYVSKAGQAPLFGCLSVMFLKDLSEYKKDQFLFSLTCCDAALVSADAITLVELSVAVLPFWLTRR